MLGGDGTETADCQSAHGVPHFGIDPTQRDHITLSREPYAAIPLPSHHLALLIPGKGDTTLEVFLF